MTAAFPEIRAAAGTQLPRTPAWVESDGVGTRPARVGRDRFYLLTEVLGLDRGRAAGWTPERLLQDELGDIEGGGSALVPSSVAMAEALQNR